MFSCALGLHSNASDNFYLQDSNSKTCYIVDLKTLLNSRRFVPDEQFRYSSEVLPTSDLCLLDDNRYIGYHMWYLDDKQFSKVDSPLGYYQKGEDSGKGMDDFPFFVASVMVLVCLRTHKLRSCGLRTCIVMPSESIMIH